MMQQLQGSNSVQRPPSNGGDGAAKKQPWYKRVLGGLMPWARPAAAIAAPPALPAPARTAERRPLWWWTSLKMRSAALAKQVCVCAPLCSYDGIMGVHVDAVAPTRIRGAGSAGGGGISPSPPRRASPATVPAAVAPAGQGARTAANGGGGLSPASPRRGHGARTATGGGGVRSALSPLPWRASSSRPSPAVAVAPAAVEGPRRRVSFSGESLGNDELVRRFVMAQEGLPRRGETDIASRHRRRKWRAPGASRLRRMSLPHVAADEAGETNRLY